MECRSKQGCSCEKQLSEKYPLSKKNNPELFYDICQHALILCDVAERVQVPMEELIEFFYKGKLKFDLINEQEEVLREYGQGNTLLREMSQNDGSK